MTSVGTSLLTELYKFPVLDVDIMAKSMPLDIPKVSVGPISLIESKLSKSGRDRSYSFASESRVSSFL
jgi:hypothetical protein